MVKCKYCNKEYKENGIKFHEKYCKLNPNRIEYPCSNMLGNHKGTRGYSPWNKGKTKETDERIAKYGKTNNERYRLGLNISPLLGTHHTEEAKRNLSLKRKQYLKDHPEKCHWRSKDKFISKPCEYLKEQLRQNNISFIEEYRAFDDYSFDVDIAWPDLKIGIEVNGTQHYNSDGTLKEYYQKRHDIFIERGWKIYEILYSRVYKLNILDFLNENNIDYYDKDYTGKYFSWKGQN